MKSEVFVMGNRARQAKAHYKRLIRLGATDAQIAKAKATFEANQTKYLLLKSKELWSKSE